MTATLTRTTTLAADAFTRAAALDATRNGALIKTAMGALFDACLLEGREDLPDTEAEWQAFIQSTGPAVKASVYSIAAYVAKTTVAFDIEWISEDWRSWQKLCRLLSEVAFLTETYEAFLSDKDREVLGQAEAEELVETISGTGGLPAGSVPDHMPASHWWWWYPEDVEAP